MLIGKFNDISWLEMNGYPLRGHVTVTAAVMEGVGLLMEFNSTAFL